MWNNPDSPIFQKWQALGGDSGLGNAVGDLQLSSDRVALYLQFVNGVIFSTTSYGAVIVSTGIFNKWAFLPSNVQAEIGYPVGDWFTSPDGGQAAYFERGMIVVRSDGQAFEVRGAIFGRYHAYQDVKGGLGLPLADVETAPNQGRRARFDGGDIYETADGKAAAIYGDIRKRWEALGGAGGNLGYPVSDENPIPGDGTDMGRFNQFEHGVIYWSGQTGAWPVSGPILECWQKQYGGARGDLGFPIDEEKASAGGGQHSQNFQYGTIVLHTDGKAYGFTGLELFVNRFYSPGTDEDSGAADAGVRLYVWHDVKAGGEVKSTGRLPPEGDAPPNWQIQMTVPLTTLVRPDLQVSVFFEGWDPETIGSDDLLGRINHGNLDNEDQLPPYTMANLWGTLEDEVHAEAFLETDYVVRAPGKPFDANKSFRQQNFWSFHNSTKDELGSDLYALTYSDISESGGLSLDLAEDFKKLIWDALFYDIAYKGLGKAGYCYGMCLESIYAQTQHSIFAEPIFKNQLTDSDVTREINIKHGYQLGDDEVKSFLGMFISGMTSNPVAMYEQSKAANDAGDYPLISMLPSLFGTGHTVRPYFWGVDDQNDDHLFIRIANPNKPASAYPPKSTDDDSPGNRIEIYKGDNSFQYQHKTNPDGTPDVWSGWIFFTPLSTLSRQPSTPLWEFAALLALGGGVLLVLAGDADSQQLTDNAGRTFYDPSLSAPPTAWSHIRQDAGGRIPHMARLPLLHNFGAGADQPQPELYYLRGQGRTLQHEVVPHGGTAATSYQWAMRSATLSVAMTLQGTAGRDVLTMERVGAADQAVSLKVDSLGLSRTAQMVVEGWRDVDPTQRKLFYVHDLTLAPGHALKLQMHAGGQELLVQNSGPTIGFKLVANSSSPRELTVDAGRSLRIRPVWSQMDAAWEITEAGVGIWHLAEGQGIVAEDNSGHGNHGTLSTPDHAGQTSPAWIEGPNDGTKALRFDGNSFVVVQNAPALEPQAVTVAAWVRLPRSPEAMGPNKYIVSKGARECAVASYGLYTGPSSGLSFYISNGVTYVSSSDAGPGVWDGSWHHIVATFGQGSIILYVDGQQVGEPVATQVSLGYGLPTNDRLYIGTYHGTCDLGFVGDVSDVRVWGHALSADEVQLLEHPSGKP